uniref:Putative lipocalin-2 1 n=1 Tax=Amblyomma triste TaxID=251400 RepID=A0A023GAM7_AMBTT
MLLLLVTLSFLGTTFSYDLFGQTTPIWRRKEGLEKFQNAWQSLNTPVGTEYVLYKATYQNDEYSWGRKFKCMTVKIVSVNPARKSVTSRYTFLNATAGVHHVTEVVKAVKRGGSGTPNAFEHHLAGGVTKLTDHVIYTDQVCDLLNVPYKQNGKGCELWVRKSFVRAVPQCCLFMFNVFCANSGYNLYNVNECKHVRDPVV